MYAAIPTEPVNTGVEPTLLLALFSVITQFLMVLFCAPSLRVLKAITALGCIVIEGANDTTKLVAFVIDVTVVFPENAPVPEITLTEAPTVIPEVLLTLMFVPLFTEFADVVEYPLSNP